MLAFEWFLIVGTCAAPPCACVCSGGCACGPAHHTKHPHALTPTLAVGAGVRTRQGGPHNKLCGQPHDAIGDRSRPGTPPEAGPGFEAGRATPATPERRRRARAAAYRRQRCGVGGAAQEPGSGLLAVRVCWEGPANKHARIARRLCRVSGTAQVGLGSRRVRHMLMQMSVCCLGVDHILNI